jgi:hypothetical protein
MSFAEDEGYDAYDIDDEYESERGRDVLTAKELGIDVVDLVGTAKQIEWAESIRDKMLNAIGDYDEPQELIDTLRMLKSASWFIEHRSESIDTIIKELDKMKHLSVLSGSDKQIAWAEQIRTTMIAALEQVYNVRCREIEGEPRVRLHKNYKNVMTQLNQITYASWWIESRNASIDWAEALETGHVKVGVE